MQVLSAMRGKKSNGSLWVESGMSQIARGRVTKPAEARLKVETEPSHHQLKLVASNGTNWLKPVGEVRHHGHNPTSAG
jgi:hypothetical protein